MTEFRAEKKFKSSGTATDGYDTWNQRVDGVDILKSLDVQSLSDAIQETQKALVDGYATTTLLPLAVSFEAGQTLIYDGVTQKMIPGASGDSSLKLQSILADGTLQVKGGSLLLADGRELATYDGAGLLASDFKVDLTLDAVLLGLIEGGALVNDTIYYLYIDLLSLSSAALVQTDTGREIFSVESTNFKLSSTSPDNTNLKQYAPLGFIRYATAAWDPAVIDTLAFRRHDLAPVNASPVVYALEAITAASHPALTVISHNANVLPKDQRWTAIINTDADGYSSQLDNSWLIDIKDNNSLEVDFSGLAAADTVSIKLENTGITANTVPVKTFDTGVVLGSSLSLPLTHGLGLIPTAVVLQRETATAGQWENLDTASYIAASSSQIFGDLTALAADNIRIIASSGVEAVVATVSNSIETVTADNTVVTSGTYLLDSTAGGFVLTLPAVIETLACCNALATSSKLIPRNLNFSGSK